MTAWEIWHSAELFRKVDRLFLDLYEERTPLYEKYAQITIDCENKIFVKWSEKSPA